MPSNTINITITPEMLRRFLAEREDECMEGNSSGDYAPLDTSPWEWSIPKPKKRTLIFNKPEGYK